jgi:hypothetical protein
MAEEVRKDIGLGSATVYATGSTMNAMAASLQYCIQCIPLSCCVKVLIMVWCGVVLGDIYGTSV